MIPSGIIISTLSLVTSINHKIHSDICIYRSVKLQTNYLSRTAIIHTGRYGRRIFFIYVADFYICTAIVITYLDAIAVLYAIVIAHQQQI